MPKILCIESSTEVCSVAITENGSVVDFIEDADGLNHSKLLTVFIDELLIRNQLAASDLGAVAVSQGPGSYTGLRIGVSAAKGFCFGAGLPLIAVCPLQAMAMHVISNCATYKIENTVNTLFIPMIDARRMEVYQAVFDANGNALEKVEALIIDENAYASLLENHSLVFFGNGAGKCSNVINHPNAVFLQGVITSAKHMAALANQKYNNNEFVDLAYFEPFYLKDFIATTPKNSVLRM